MFPNNTNKPVFGIVTTTSPFSIGTNLPTNTTTPFGRSSLFGNTTNTFSSASLQSFTSAALKQKGLFSNISKTQQNNFDPTANFFNIQSNTNPNLFDGQQNIGFTFESPLINSLETKGSNIKFNPRIGTDVVLQKGISRNINTRFNCIVCMKEYESKSLEEIRWEDYESNRKGPQINQTIVPTFGEIGNSKQMFENKPLFSQTNITNFVPAENKLQFFGQPSPPGLTNFANKPNEQIPFSKQYAFSGDKPFSFTATPPTVGLKNYSSPPQAQLQQYSFNTSTPVAPISQPVTFGSPTYGQPSVQVPNTNLFNKPSQIYNNFSQMSENSEPMNSFQPSTASASSSRFGRTHSATSFGKNMDAGLSFQPAGNKIEPNFNFGQQNIVSQPAPLNLEQPGFEAEMQSMTNNFTSLHKPMSYYTEQNNLSMISNYDFSTLPHQSFSPFKSEEPDNFYTIVEKVYESFPYRKVFDGITVKTFMKDDITSPRVLNKIVQEESLPETPIINNKVKLKMLTGPKDMSKDNHNNPCKFKWLEATETTYSFRNNLLLGKKSGKHLMLSKNKQQSTEEELFKKMLPNATTDKSVSQSILQQINVLNQESKYNQMDKSCNLEILNLLQEDSDAKNNNEAENLEMVAKQEEFLSQLAKSFLEDFKTSLKETKEDHSNKETIDLLSKELFEEQSFVDKQITQTSENLGDKSFVITDDSNSKEEQEEDDKVGLLNPKLEINRFQNPNTKESMEAGDNASNISQILLNICGVKLTRKDYYTIPPLEEIHKYHNFKGECMVKDFKIGRYGFGNIYFPNEIIDISNLNLDEIVFFDFHEAIVYPDDDKKPEIGEGLNRPAQITLEKVWPRHPITRQILIDPKEINKVNFVERLKRLSQKQNAMFVDYRPDTGSWVFQVEHFSKFSFTESDDEEIAKELEDAKIESKRKAQEEEAKRIGLGGKKVLEEKDSNVTQEITFSKAELKFKKRASNNVTILKYSFFDGLPIDETNDTIPNLSISTSRRNIGLQKRPIIAKPKHTNLLNRNRIVPKEKSLIVSSTTSNYINQELFKGKSFRIGWGSGFLFVAKVTLVSEWDSISRSTEYRENIIKCLKIGDLSQNPQMMYLKEHLEVVFAESTLIKFPVPFFTVNHGHQSLISHRNIAKSIDEDFHLLAASHYTQVWNLCFALWGPEATTPTNRRELFSKWLEDTADPFIKNELKRSAGIKNIFIYLTGHKITEASELADRERLTNLSILITQSGGQESAKKVIHEQLEQWNTSNILKDMDKNIVKIYMLLGGIPYLSGINVCENLDWIRALAIYFWYICPAGTSLINAIEAYQNAFLSGYAKPPTPEDYECSSGTVYDMLYQIMILFVTPTMPLEKVVNPITHTSDPLDYRLSWCLLQVLNSLKVGTISEKLANDIHVNFASQLENMKLWEWSVFVLLFIKDESYKINAVLRILEKNLDPDRLSIQNINIEDFLVNNFKIPSEWIHSILANKTNCLKSDLEMYQHLILTRDWCKAHQIAAERLIPDLIINGQFNDLFMLLKRLIPGKQDILLWDTEVGLVLDYLEFNRKITDDNEMITEKEMADLKQKLTDICLRVKNFSTNLLKQKVAISEISKSLINLLRLFYCELQQPNIKNIKLIVGLMKELPVPPDFRQNALKGICSMFFNN